MSGLELLKKKIISSDDAARIARSYEMFGKKVVFTNGCFDILHCGHILYLAESRSYGNCLMVGLNSDASVKLLNKSPERPVNHEKDRALLLASLYFVDYVIIFNEDTPLELIKKIRPDILVKGGDYKEEDIVGREIVRAKGGEIKIVPYVDNYSTTSLIDKIKKSS